MTSSIEYQPPQYNSNPNDSRTLDHEETILGHLLTEKQYSLKDSLYYLTSYAKEESKTWDDTETIASGGFWVSLVAAGTAMVAMGSGPLGLTVGGVVAAIGAGSSWILKDTAEAVGKLRRTEFELHRHHPWIRDRLWEMSQQGATAAELVAIYDRMVFGLHANGIPADGNAIAGSMQMQAIAPMGAGADRPGLAPTTESQSQRGIQNGQALDAAKCESQSLAQTELQPSGAAAPSMQHIVSPVWNPALDLGENPQSALIVGTPGSGKGMIISNAVRTLKENNPGLTIFVIDPKADPKERGYWEGISDAYRSYSLLDGEDADEGAMWLLSCIAEFRAITGPKLCIFDELMSVATELELADTKLKALQKLKKFVVNLIGQGDSRSIWLWAMTQSPQVKDLGLGSGGVRANLRVIGLVSPKNMTAVNALVSTQIIPKPDGGIDELRQIMSNSPVNRAVFDGKIARWLPMPELPNHSGFDRDSRKSSPAPETRSPAPSIEEKKAEIQRMKIEIERLREGNRERMDERISAGIDYEMHDSFDPPRDRLERLWDASPDAIEVEAAAIVERPDGLDDYPLVATVWDYLDGKDPRSLKQISDAMKAKGKIPEDVLKSKIPNYDNYKEGIKTVLLFGVSQGYLKQISEDAYEAIRKQ